MASGPTDTILPIEEKKYKRLYLIMNTLKCDPSLLKKDLIKDFIKSYLKDDDSNTIKWKNYDRSKEYVNKWKPTELPKIALIYAVGGIQSGKSNPGPSGSSVMGDLTIRKAIKKARENKDIDAIVFRIDSGGGSALASDQMW